MNWFGKLPGFRTSPPGLERDILRRLPRVLWLGTLLLALPALAMRLLAGPHRRRMLAGYAIGLLGALIVIGAAIALGLTLAA